MNKSKLRQRYIEIRNKVDKAYRDKAAKSAAAVLTRQSFFVTSQHIACYLPFNKEFNSWPIIDAVWKAKKQCYLPVLQEDKTLLFIRYRKNDPLKQNQYGIFEPEDHANKIAAYELNIVITPLIAFDRCGARLGTGGGYYDRTFCNFDLIHKKPLMVGLAYQAQEAESLPREPWDIKLDGVITEQGYAAF